MLAFLACSLLSWQPSAKPPADSGVLVTDGAVTFLAAAGAPQDDLTAALANHPDVQIAEAKLRVAQAELAKVKLVIAQQVTAARAKLSQAKAEAEAAEKDSKRVQALHRSGTVTDAVARQSFLLSQRAKEALAVAEADLRAVVGTTPAWQVKATDGRTITADFAVTLARDPAITPSAARPTGPAADKLREVVGTTFKLEFKRPLPVDEAFAAVLKGAGAESLAVRLPDWAKKPYLELRPELVPKVPAHVGEMTFVGWVNFIADSVKDQLADLIGRSQELTPDRFGPHDLYVREYGLLFTAVKQAPPGAITLSEFAKQTAIRSAPAVPADVLDRLRKALAKTINRAEMTVPPAVFFKELFAATGPELVVQSPLFGVDPITIPGGEKTVAAWLEQLQDQWNTGRSPTNRYEYFVRDYGLLLCPSAEAPAGAVPLSAVK